MPRCLSTINSSGLPSTSTVHWVRALCGAFCMLHAACGAQRVAKGARRAREWERGEEGSEGGRRNKGKDGQTDRGRGSRACIAAVTSDKTEYFCVLQRAHSMGSENVREVLSLSLMRILSVRLSMSCLRTCSRTCCCCPCGGPERIIYTTKVHALRKSTLM